MLVGGPATKLWASHVIARFHSLVSRRAEGLPGAYRPKKDDSRDDNRHNLPLNAAMASQRPAAQGTRRSQNGNIMSFFKPISQSQSQSQSQSPPPPTPASLPPNTPLITPGTPVSPAPPSSLPPSCLSTPCKPAAVEIPASDESNSEDSDSSLQDLSDLIGRRPPPAAPSTPPKLYHDPYATPRAKRIAVQFDPSPLALIPKLKFDMKALAEDARRDDATTASSKRAKEAAAAGDKQVAASSDHAASDDAFVKIVKERGGQDAQKVLRAVQRSDTGASPRFCFFAAEYSRPASMPAPKAARSGPWRLLTQGSLCAREQHLASGVPQMAICKTKGLPDELLQWILDELCVQESDVVREGYRHIVADCPDEQLARLVTPQRLGELFVRLGARSEQLEPPRVEPRVGEPYQDRDWSALLAFLLLLAAISRKLSVPAVQFATQTLLLMSMDSFLLCNPDVLTRFGSALRSLVDAISGSSWDAFCLDISASLSGGDKSQSIRANALLCLPLSSERLHDLRRRLAIAFLFDESPLAPRTKDSVTIQDFIDVLDSPGFNITLQTDFAELKSRIVILDMAIDDGSAVVSDGRQDDARFNQDVDRLAQKLGEIWRRINDSGMKLARTETKSVVEWVQQRLLHSVRTRKRVKKSVFDLSSQEEDPFELRRQQDYMTRFLRKASKQTDE
ncbi:hypothetical protein XA68_14038 [Ophiocordyceps unilateralis]|uniref:Uncharacterized protein n=1 Tax=Ophiocordyceps unilateralis TaxID=268505 RepID=A0A2A9PA80_OPHUN|nr:hypothetical protein XA68_14038 [Ophiocordyceps unilateralis]